MPDRTHQEREALIAGGLVRASVGRPISSQDAASVLGHRLHTSALWRPAFVPPDRSGIAAVGEALPVWEQPAELSTADATALVEALATARPEFSVDDEYLRVRVESEAAIQLLWDIGGVGATMIVPSLGSRGSLTKSLTWRWPLRVGIVDSDRSNGWLDDVRNSGHHGVVYDAEMLIPGEGYEVAIVHAADLRDLDHASLAALGETTCVVAVGDEPAIDLLYRIENRTAPTIAIGICAPPAVWWRELFEAMTHDRPIDVAVAELRHRLQVDAVIAGPATGMDVTATAHWYAAVAPDHPEMAAGLHELEHWDWSSEGGGGTNTRQAVDAVRARGGDPRIVVPPPGGGALGRPAHRGVPRRQEHVAALPDGDAGDESVDSSEPAAGRFVQAVIVDGAHERLTLVSDQVNVLRCWIGPDRDEFASSTGIAVEEVDDDLVLQVDLIVDELGVVATRSMLLPRGDGARSSDCDLPIPPITSGFFRGELVFTLNGRMYELVEITGLVVAGDADGGAMQPLQLKSIVERRELTELRTRSDSTAMVDVTTRDGEIVVREFGTRSSGVYSLAGKQNLIRTLTRNLYATETSLVRRDQHGIMGDAVDSEWTALVHNIATHGWLLHQALHEQGFGNPGERFEMINRLPDDYVPIEFVYDRGAPAPDAVVDPGCMTALRQGKDDCGRCHPFDDLTPQEIDQNPRICPFGFWSLGKIIERHDADEAGRLSGTASAAGLQRLRRIESVLTGLSVKIRDEDQALLHERLGSGGRRVLVAETWEQWQQELAREPTVLLALPHHEDVGGIGTLEIRGDASLGLQRDLRAFVRTPTAPSPILILLGCETDTGGDFGHPSFARKFNGHASIVIGTLSKVLGRHAVPFAHRLVDALVEAQDDGGDVGTVLRDVRRRMFADGYLMALGVIALGDGDWRLAGEDAA